MNRIKTTLQKWSWQPKTGDTDTVFGGITEFKAEEALIGWIKKYDKWITSLTITQATEYQQQHPQCQSLILRLSDLEEEVDDNNNYDADDL